MSAQARSSITRQQLLDAARRVLIEQGYAQLGEARVCDLAGVTRGALRYHFPDGLYDLLPALIEELIEIEARKIDATGALQPRERIYLALYGLAMAGQQTDSLAILEVWMAARGDARLSAGVNPVMQRANLRIFGLTQNAPFEPDLLAWRLLLHGASLHVFNPDFDRSQLGSALKWVLQQWPAPESLRLPALS